MKNNPKIFISIFVIVIIGVFAYLLINRTPKEKATSVITENSVLGCYVAHLQKDIYTLVLQSEDKGIVTGVLAYNNYQKDSSSGSFDGTFADNILLGNYSFDSEGMRSDRQVIFKKVGDSFIQGFGPTQIIDGKEIFDADKISYDPKSTFTKSKDCLESFADSENVFSFNYNPFFKVVGRVDALPTTDWSLNSLQKGKLLASVIIPRTYMPGTNFSNARLTVGQSTDSNAIKNCLSKTQESDSDKGTVTISGHSFKKFTFNGAGAGNFYDTVSYKGVVDEACFAIEYTIHSTNIANYSPNQRIKEFDRSKIQGEMEKIIKSIKIF